MDDFKSQFLFFWAVLSRWVQFSGILKVERFHIKTHTIENTKFEAQDPV